MALFLLINFIDQIGYRYIFFLARFSDTFSLSARWRGKIEKKIRHKTIVLFRLSVAIDSILEFWLRQVKCKVIPERKWGKLMLRWVWVHFSINAIYMFVNAISLCILSAQKLSFYHAKANLIKLRFNWFSCCCFAVID